MTRILALLYGFLCYATFFVTFLYAIGFVSGAFVPKHIDSGTDARLLGALLGNLALLGLFAVQHSGMARPAFKRWWARLVPTALERSTYVLLSSLALILLFWLWQPLPQTIWHIGVEPLRWAIHALAALGWLLVLTGTFVINHFELFGLQQVWRYGRDRRDDRDAAPFVTRAYYRIVRHPLMLGFLIAFWATPTMTLGHLLFALATTGYVLIAVRFLEERDLVEIYGDTYRDYQRRVPMILPLPRASADRRLAGVDCTAPPPQHSRP